MPSIANAVVVGKADDPVETETCVRRRRDITPTPASMIDPSRPIPTTIFWSLADRTGGTATTGTGCLAGAATGADCLVWLTWCTTTIGCSCCQSRGLGVG